LRLSVSLSLCLYFLERLTACESRVQVMPPFDDLLAASPAQVDDPAVTFARKVQESLVEVFDLDAMAEYLLGGRYESCKRAGVQRAFGDAAAALALAGAFGFVGQPAERPARLVNSTHQPFDFGQQCVRFFEGEKFHRVSIRKGTERHGKSFD